MAKNYNTEPYRDDFNPTKGYHRILFKPERPVQTRELTQLQTMAQYQTSLFASSIYSQNSPVTGGNVTTNLNCYYITLNETYNNRNIDVNEFLNKTITDASGMVTADVIAVSEKTGSSGEAGDPPTIIVNYLSGSMFKNGELVYVKEDGRKIPLAITTTNSEKCTGNSSTASVDEGVYFVMNGTTPVISDTGETVDYKIGNFVTVQKQTVILEKYSNEPTMRVGLNIVEKTITADDDESLNDPAIGSTNYSAPGADRYQIKLILETRPYSLGNDENYIELVKYKNGIIEKQVDSSIYSDIDDYFAKRTYDTNGDFVVNDFSITPEKNDDDNKYNLKIGKGLAYVRGYRIENQSDYVLENDRARDVQNTNNNYCYFNYGSYLNVVNLKGTFSFDELKRIDLHLVGHDNIVLSDLNTYKQTLVGSALIRNVVYSSCYDDSNTKTYVYKANIVDVQTNSISANAISGSDTTLTFAVSDNFSKSNSVYDGCTISITDGVGKGYISTISSYTVSDNIATVSLTSSLNVSLNSTSKVTISFETKDINSLVERNNLVLTACADVDSSSKNNGKTQIKNQNQQECISLIGQSYVDDISDSSYTTQYKLAGTFSSGSPSTLTLMAPANCSFIGSGKLSDSSCRENFTVVIASGSRSGDILKFSDSNTITISSDGASATFSTTEIDTSTQVNVIAKLTVNDASFKNFLRQKTKVEGDITSISGAMSLVGNKKIDLAKGQVWIPNSELKNSTQNISLLVSDVIRIRKIIDTKQANADLYDNMLSDNSYDVTSNYTFSDGQKDYVYDYATISLKNGRKSPQGDLLVIFDYYQHSSGSGYFCINSYPTKVEAYERYYTSNSGNEYRLSDCIDFRPTRVNATEDFSIIDRTCIPVDETNFVCDYNSYLGRNDLLVLSKDNNFQIIQGSSSVNPKYPSAPDGALIIAKISHNPYTIYIPSEANGNTPSMSIIKMNNRRWTMKDITGLQKRIDNLEYYTSLNLLEQSAKSLQVPDEDGLNRFKNGILVDNFSSYSVADSKKSDFNASIDTLNGELSATREVSNFQLQSEAMLNSLGNPDNLNFEVKTINTGTNVFMLPYETANCVVQQLASNTVNLNPFGVSNDQGTVYLNPPMDNWVDNEKNPDILIVDPNISVYQQSNNLNILNTSNWQSIPGTQHSTSTTSTSTSRFAGGMSIKTTTTTTSTVTQQQDVTMGYWESVGDNYSVGNGFITDVSIQPYIRSQDIIISANGLKNNTKIDAYFDGIKVNDYIKNADIISLENVVGEFSKNDIIGYTDNSDGYNKFIPIGVVLASVVADKNVFLYIVSNYHSYHNISSKKITNSTYDSTGNYTGFTAYGTSLAEKVITNNYSGCVTSVGEYQKISDTENIKLVSNIVPGHNAFMQRYGVWNNQDMSSGTFDVTFEVNSDVSGSYYMCSSGSLNIHVYLNDVLVRNGTNTNTNYLNTVKLKKGKNTLRIVNDSPNHPHKQVACAISTKEWDSSGNTTGDVIWDTKNSYLSSQSELNNFYKLNGGGYYFNGIKQFTLGSIASDVDDFYVGSKINITSVYVDSDNKKQTKNYIANVVAYDGQNRLVTIDSEVGISYGYNSDIGDITSSYTIQGSSVYDISTNEETASGLCTNYNGEYHGIFTVPSGMFRTGDRVLRLDNRTTPNDPDSATTWAEATFTASGLSTKSTSLDFSASIDSAKNTIKTTNTRVSTTVSTSTRSRTWRYVERADPVCQTFILYEDQYPNGLFLHSVKIFFKTKPLNTNTPVTLSILGTTNGYPDGSTLDNSIVSLTSDKVKVSDTPHYLDENSYTEFVFNSPVYILPNTLYAILLKSDSTEYNIWVAAQNATALPSSTKNYPTDADLENETKIGNAPYVGNLFESQNSITWVAEINKSMMFVIERCVFDTKSNPKIKYVVPKNNPSRKNITNELKYNFDANNISNINSVYNNGIVELDAVNFTTTDFVPTTSNVKYSYSAYTKNGRSSKEEYITPGKYGCPTYENIHFDDGQGERYILPKDTNSLQFWVDMSTENDAVSPMVSDDGLSVYAITYNINNLGITEDSLFIKSGGSGYSANTRLEISYPDFGISYAELEPIIENGVITGINILNSGEGYLNTPTITVVDGDSSGSGAEIQCLSEFSNSGGNAIAKYVTNKCTLADGNDSEDLRTYLTAYKPNGSDIRVFYKVMSRDDGRNFDDFGWKLMTTINNNNTYSVNRSDYIEYVFAPGSNNVADGQITYTTDEGNTYTNFYQFAIKIVMTTNDKTKVPVIKSMVTLALPRS